MGADAVATEQDGVLLLAALLLVAEVSPLLVLLLFVSGRSTIVSS